MIGGVLLVSVTARVGFFVFLLDVVNTAGKILLISKPIFHR